MCQTESNLTRKTGLLQLLTFTMHFNAFNGPSDVIQLAEVLLDGNY